MLKRFILSIAFVTIAPKYRFQRLPENWGSMTTCSGVINWLAYVGILRACPSAVSIPRQNQPVHQHQIHKAVKQPDSSPSSTRLIVNLNTWRKFEVTGFSMGLIPTSIGHNWKPRLRGEAKATLQGGHRWIYPIRFTQSWLLEIGSIHNGNRCRNQ